MTEKQMRLHIRNLIECNKTIIRFMEKTCPESKLIDVKKLSKTFSDTVKEIENE